MAIDLRISDDKDELAWAAADWFVERVHESEEPIAVCLTGGSTPEGLYRQLAARPLPWERMHIFWTDERFVPCTDSLSNTRMAWRALLNHVPIPADQVHAIPTELTRPEDSAEAYEKELKAFYGADRLDPARPLFDIVINGLGDDGHTASLFPDSPALDERERWAVAAEPGMAPLVRRVTLTYPVLESCRAAAFLVSGAGKKDIIGRVLGGEDYPASRLAPAGKLTWLVDREAAPDGSFLDPDK